MTGCCEPGDRSRDLTASPTASFWLWRFPAAIVVAGALTSPIWRTLLWTSALTVAGTGCTVNAARSRRMHCYFTGPFYLLGALLTLGYGTGLLPLGTSGWWWIAGVVGLGALLLPWLPERLWGPYREHPARGTAR